MERYANYVEHQLKAVVNPLKREIQLKLQELDGSDALNSGPLLYSAEEIVAILSECDRLVRSVPASEPQWTPVRNEFEDFLRQLPVGAYLTPEQVYRKGKPREYRKHVEEAASRVESADSVILDVAGCTGWASTVFKHLGFPRAVTIELNPINIIGGRYVWGHQSIIQGDAHSLRKCRHPDIDFERGGAVDFIFCRYALEHFHRLDRVFAEFDHVLRPGGKVLAIVGRGAGQPKAEYGDVRAFADAASIYREAPTFCMVHYELMKNADTQSYEHFVLLQRPDDPALPSHGELMDRLQSTGIVRRAARRIRRFWHFKLGNLPEWTP